MTAERRWEFSVVEGHGYLYDNTLPDGRRIVAVMASGTGARASICDLLAELERYEKAYFSVSGNDNSGTDLAKPYKATDLNFSERKEGE